MNSDELIFMERRIIDLEAILRKGDINPQIRAIHKSEYLSKLNILMTYKYPVEDTYIEYGRKLRNESK